MSKKIETNIAAFGFDKAGFQTPANHVDAGSYQITFIGFNSDKSLEEFDAVMMPSGIFEEFRQHHDSFGMYRHTTVHYSKEYLAEREKQLLNSLGKKWWGAFLLEEVVTKVDGRSCVHSDLVKKILSNFFDGVRAHDPEPYVTPKSDEFRVYLEKWGICRTDLGYTENKEKTRVLAENGSKIAAAECAGKFFFLPFMTTKKDSDSLVAALTSVVDSVLEYKKKNDIYLPAWVDEITFERESEISTRLAELHDEAATLEVEAGHWKRYKAILTTSGENLRQILVSILREFYGLAIKDVDEYVEDALILDDEGNALFVAEAKGINGGLKREQINQVDSHRERLGLDASTPGLLFLNDFMKTDGFEGRKAKTFEESHLEHARKLNVRVLRSVTLLELMISHEAIEDRGKHFLQACQNADPLIIAE